jgi:hypothetical protein
MSCEFVKAGVARPGAAAYPLQITKQSQSFEQFVIFNNFLKRVKV